MAYYERLSALDASFLALEDDACHMHVGAVLLFEPGPLRTPLGGVDIERIRQAIAARLHLVPRFRQRLARIPYERLPVWVDDDRFRLPYHVRHTALPRPGDERQLKRLAGRIQSQALDRRRPLWELWVVEGVAGGRFALISKTHHCMIDGVSGADLMSVLLSPSPEPDDAVPEPWTPRPRPTAARLLVDEVLRRAGQPLELARRLAAAARDPLTTASRLLDTAAGLAETFAPAFTPTSPTPFNVEIGPHRRFDWTEMRIAELRPIRERTGSTLNDVVLAIVSGALRTFLAHRGLDPDRLDIRAGIPVSVRAATEHGRLGNRVTQLQAALPVHLADPLARLEAVTTTLRRLKESRQALGGEVLTTLSDWTVPNLLVQAVRLVSLRRPYNLVVTNVPGPQLPLYLQGARMLTAYPVVPLFQNLGLVVGLFSYDGGLFWGINADWETLPDLHVFVEALEEARRELAAAAAGAPEAARRPPAGRRPGGRRPGGRRDVLAGGTAARE